MEGLEDLRSGGQLVSTAPDLGHPRLKSARKSLRLIRYVQESFCLDGLRSHIFPIPVAVAPGTDLRFRLHF